MNRVLFCSEHETVYAPATSSTQRCRAANSMGGGLPAKASVQLLTGGWRDRIAGKPPPTKAVSIQPILRHRRPTLLTLNLRAELVQPGLQIVEPAFFNDRTLSCRKQMTVGGGLPAKALVQLLTGGWRDRIAGKPPPTKAVSIQPILRHRRPTLLTLNLRAELVQPGLQIVEPAFFNDRTLSCRKQMTVGGGLPAKASVQSLTGAGETASPASRLPQRQCPFSKSFATGGRHECSDR
ncbi:hypothetical protein SAMN05216593_11536 [Pseudomonas asturiensis]|uniref:Uncharacterized protein n=1 Tax=Pseudomonas asturiensis TaxID=1190415 RepID=A0A1M7PY53_9PSED|nr:hypothetical protein SAMN05216593_11536 [Pseudomonas asturiensis]